MSVPQFNVLPDGRIVTLLAPREDSRLVAARKDASATVQFYGNVGEAFGGYGAAQFAAVLDEVKEAKAVTLYMSSEGGDFIEGIAIYSQLARFAESHDLAIVVDGIAASAGSVVAMAGKTLRMSHAAQLMIHEARGGRYGTSKDLRAQAEVIDSANGTMADIYAKRTGLSVEQIRAFFAAGDTYFNAEQAVELGFADAIEGEEKPAPKRAAAITDRHVTAARINAQLARERRGAASRNPEPGQPGTKPQS
jgi:ATP-dependent Clp endopeptidase proteolytic subunit ClpP